MDIRTLGIDLAKNLFRVHGVDAHGRTVVERELRRRQLLPFVAQLRPCLVGMEACGGAHYWAREIAKRGHEVRLMSPRFVRPCVKSNKNDACDAEAICEAVGRSSMRSVAVKSVTQQDMLALHRVRSLLIRERTALMNQMRGLLAEFGIVVAQGPARLRRALAAIQEQRDDGVGELLREMLVEMGERLRWLEPRLKRYDLRIATLAGGDERAARLMKVGGRGWSADRDRAHRRGRRRSAVPPRARAKRLAWTGAAPALERRAHDAARHQQARRPLSAHAADPWRTLNVAPSSAQARPTQPLDRSVEGAPRREYRGRGAGE